MVSVDPGKDTAIRRSAGPKVVLVHDYFTQRGGGERLAGHLATVYPDAPMFTSVLDRAALPSVLMSHRVTATWLQRAFAAGVPLQALCPVMGSAFGGLDLGVYDVVLSSSAAFAHRVRPRPGSVHVCYCHTPAAFLYRPEYYATRSVGLRALAPALAVVRRGDRQAARQVDRYLANSHFTAERIWSSYGIEADVLYPAIDTAAFVPTTQSSGRFLVVSRLRPHKAIDLAIGAANLLQLPLDIIGEGSDLARLQSLAGPTVRFLGWRTDAEVAAAMARCVALIVPGIEDFGMVSAEVQAAGRPPIGSAIGGTAEIAQDGVTGFLVAERTSAAFAVAMRRALSTSLDADALLASAQRFDISIFAASLRRIVDETLDRRVTNDTASVRTTRPTRGRR